MRNSQLDTKIEFIEGAVRLVFDGIFFINQWPFVQEKFDSFISEGQKKFFVHLQKAKIRDAEILQNFLELQNNLAGRKAKLILIFDNKSNVKFFAPYKHLFEIYPNYETYRKQGFVRALRTVGLQYSKKTGIRISPTTAALVLLLLAGWVMTLLTMIQTQSEDLDKSRREVQELIVEQKSISRELKELETKLAPLRQLGLLKDSLSRVKYKNIPDWVDHLRKKQK